MRAVIGEAVFVEEVMPLGSLGDGEEGFGGGGDSILDLGGRGNEGTSCFVPIEGIDTQAISLGMGL